MTEKTIYFIRHGEIQSNLDQVYSGRSDEGLTAAGVIEAERLGREVEGWGISTLFVSPLRRTVQTAEILNKYVGAPIIEDIHLMEMDLGPWTGLSKDEVARRYPEPYRAWSESPATFRWDGMETLEGIRERLARFLNHFRDERPETVAAAVTHAVVVKCVCIHCGDLDPDSYHAIPAPNLSVHRVTMGNGKCGVVRVR